MLYDKIKHYADKRHMSISELEKLADVGNGVIGKWKDDDKANPRVQTLLAISRVLKISLNTLMKDESGE